MEQAEPKEAPSQERTFKVTVRVEQNNEPGWDAGSKREKADSGMPAPAPLPGGLNCRQPLDACQHTLHVPPTPQTEVRAGASVSSVHLHHVCLLWTVEHPVDRRHAKRAQSRTPSYLLAPPKDREAVFVGWGAQRG